MRTTSIRFSWLMGLGLVAGCVHTQQPVRFQGPAALALEVLARELIALGVEPVELDEPGGILRTRWEDLNFLYGQIDEQEASIYRRYVAVVHRRPGDSELTLRAEVKVCPVGTQVGPGNRLGPRCESLPGLIEQHQLELDRLGEQLRAALARLRPSPDAAPAGQPAVVVIFDLQAPIGLLPSGAAAQLTDYLAARLASTGRFKVVPRTRLADAIRARQRESYQDSYGQEFQIELGRAMAANKLLTVQVLAAGAACTLVGTLYDLRSATTDGAATVQAACGIDRLPAGLDGLARELADQIR